MNLCEPCHSNCKIGKCLHPNDENSCFECANDNFVFKEISFELEKQSSIGSCSQKIIVEPSLETT